MGTESIKIFIKFLILSTQELLSLDDNKDGKVSIAEAFEVIYALAPKLPGVYNNLPEVTKEIKDLSAEEIDELVLWFQQEFDLPGLEREKLVAIIKKSVSFLAAAYNYYRDMKALLSA